MEPVSNKILIAGPCVGEGSEQWIIDQAGAIYDQLQQIDDRYQWIFKCSFDKANRTSGKSYRGLGLEHTLSALAQVKELFGCEVTTDIHELYQAHELRGVVDVVQIPAMLCRQTDLLASAGLAAPVVNIKGMTSASAEVMREAACKTGTETWLTYRGTAYGSSVTFDLAHLIALQALEHTTIVDITHLAAGHPKKGYAVAPLTDAAACCAAALNVDGLFLECHPNPKKALSDSGTQIPIELLPHVLEDLPWLLK